MKKSKARLSITFFLICFLFASVSTGEEQNANPIFKPINNPDIKKELQDDGHKDTPKPSVNRNTNAQTSSGESEERVIFPPDISSEGEDNFSKEKSAERTDVAESLKTYDNIPQVIYDEGFNVIEISLKDISRIVCFSGIERTVYSKEKGIEIESIDKDAFIKNLPTETVDQYGIRKVEYDKRPKELYIVCGGKTFSLLLVPKDIPAATIYLKSKYGDKKSASSYEKKESYENTLLSLIKDIYMENIPDGYEVVEINKPIKEYQEITLVYSKKYSGFMYEVQEFVVIPKVSVTLDEITLVEALQPKDPLAVSIVNLTLTPGEQTRAFIVRLNNE